jgi:signal transduction histidine kinase
VKSSIGTRYAAYLLLLTLALVATALVAAGLLASRRIAVLRGDVLQSIGAIQAKAEAEGLRGTAAYLSNRLFNPLYRLDVEQLNEEIVKVRTWLPVRRFLIAGTDRRILADGSTSITRYGQPLEGELPRASPWTPLVVARPDGSELRFAVRSGDTIAGWAVVELTETPSRVSLRQMRDEVDALWTGYRASLLYLGLLVLAITLFVGGLTAARLSRTLAAPLTEMSRAARRFAAGELEHTLAVPSRDELGELAESLNSMVRDLRRERTERERLIADLERKNAELERFTYTVSHDLKSPLVTIQGFAGYVEADMRAGDLGRARSGLARITAAGGKMQRLLDDLLHLSRMGRIVNPGEYVSLGDLAREAVELVRGEIDARGATVEIARDLPAVCVDRPRLLEVLQNLVENAVKFAGAQAQPRVEIGWRKDGGEPVFYVRDNGVGIDAAHRERVFALFEKLDPGAEGTGVGLALVRRIVEAHGGRAWAESAGAGLGSTFCFTLAEAALLSPTPSPGAAAGGAGPLRRSV